MLRWQHIFGLLPSGTLPFDYENTVEVWHVQLGTGIVAVLQLGDSRIGLADLNSGDP